jgi:hypothetical protein
MSTVSVYRCDDCDAFFHEEEVAERVYECGQCDGRSDEKRCSDCNRFASRAEGVGCPDCFAEVELVDAWEDKDGVIWESEAAAIEAAEEAPAAAAADAEYKARMDAERVERRRIELEQIAILMPQLELLLPLTAGAPKLHDGLAWAFEGFSIPENAPFGQPGIPLWFHELAQLLAPDMLEELAVACDRERPMEKRDDASACLRSRFCQLIPPGELRDRVDVGYVPGSALIVSVYDVVPALLEALETDRPEGSP